MGNVTSRTGGIKADVKKSFPFADQKNVRAPFRQAKNKPVDILRTLAQPFGVLHCSWGNLEQGRDMKRCPECGAIASGDSDSCAICGADLFQVPEEPLGEAVHEEEKLETAAADQLMTRELASARRIMMARLVVYVVDAVLILSGFLLLFNSRPEPLSKPFTPFWTAFVLIWVGFIMLLYVIIGAGPSELSPRGWPWSGRR